MKRVIILTGSETRHTFVRKFIALSGEIEVLRSYCEGLENSLHEVVGAQSDNRLRERHLGIRRQAEEDFFGLFVEHTPDDSRPFFLPRGEINAPPQVEWIREADPDLLVAYGCSLIREPLLDAFAGRFLNVHLGLSPYYRGSGTNFWPLVNGEPEFVGATFMYIDAGVDTGEIIHQVRARIFHGDTPFTIGNRLIGDMARVYRDLIVRFDELERMEQPPKPAGERVYRKKDFTEASVAALYARFADGLVERYLEEEAERCRRAPIVRNPVLCARVTA